MKLSLTSWSLPACSLPEAAGLSRVLGIDALDLGYFYGPALDKAQLLDDPEGMAGRVKQLGVTLPCFYHLFGDGLADRNLADPAHLDRNAADFERVARFCSAAEIPTVFVLPGVCNPGQSRGDALAVSARALGELTAIGAAAGVIVTIEPHVHSYLESPALVRELLDRTPGLKLTLDYAHFICLGYRQEEIDPLAAFAAHVHLRQARPGVLQAKVEQGTINFPAQLGTLRDAGFQGHMALEYVHQDYMDTLYDDVLTETIKLRDVVTAWLAA